MIQQQSNTGGTVELFLLLHLHVTQKSLQLPFFLFYFLSFARQCFWTDRQMFLAKFLCIVTQDVCNQYLTDLIGHAKKNSARNVS